MFDTKKRTHIARMAKLVVCLTFKFLCENTLFAKKIFLSSYLFLLFDITSKIDKL